jgi:ferredoxin
VGHAEIVPNRCEGFGFCEEVAGEVFQVSHDGNVQVLQKPVPERLRAAAEAAVRACPVAAIKLSDDE